MKEKLSQIKAQALERIQNATLMSEIENIRIALLGKKGELTAVLRSMGQLSPEQRPQIGQIANSVRQALDEAIDSAKAKIIEKERAHRLQSEILDVTLPGKKRTIGGLHPMTITLNQITDIFIGLGFSVAEGPDIEDDYHNFEALNIPPDHPARDEQDTFYINEQFPLRTATSPVQIRTMQSQSPPIKIIAPGRVYRSDAVDATHSPMFHQVEGLVVDKDITMADLKGVLVEFVKSLYGNDVKTRFRPHYFPFTEPSAELDISCFICNGGGCSVCKQEGWIEILGCGMVHPDVLKKCDIDPNVYSGFAFGLGAERVAMRRYNIDDLRLMFENDIRFLQQF